MGDVIRFCEPVKITSGRKKPKMAIGPSKVQKILEAFNPPECDLAACAERFGVSQRAVSRILFEHKHEKLSVRSKPRKASNPMERVKMFAGLVASGLTESQIRRRMKIKRDSAYVSLMKRAMEEELI